MDITSTILPVYDAVAKQEQYKGYEQVTRLCSRLQFLPFLCKRTHSASNDYLTSIKLVNCAGTETEILSYFQGACIAITSWTNYGGGYDTFTTSGAGGIPIIISSAIDSGASVEARSNTFTVVSGAIYYISVTLTLNSGQAPSIAIADTADKSNRVNLVNGANTVILKATAGGTFYLSLKNDAATNYALSNPRFSRMSYDFYNFTSVDYFMYNGGYLHTQLPLGNYYLKMTDGVNIFFSEWFRVTSIYTNLCNSWTGYSTFETFTFSGSSITQAVNTAGDAVCYTLPFAVANGEVIKVVFNFTLASGSYPTVAGFESGTVADIVTGEQVCTDGRNEVTLTCTKSSNLQVAFKIVGANTNFSTGPVYVIRTGGEGYTKVSFTNTLDLYDIIYQKSFTQLFWANGSLKESESEVTIEGEPRDGVLIEEKIVTAPKFAALHACSPLLAQSLETLSQHTTVTVTDTTGIAYTANNIQVENSPQYFDINKVVINFTANEKVWGLNQNNIT